MISRFHHGVPSKRGSHAFQQEVAVMRPLNGNVRLAAVEEMTIFGEPIDLGLFPHPTAVLTVGSIEA